MIRVLYVAECDQCGIDATDKNKGHLISELRKDGWLVNPTTGQALCQTCNDEQLQGR